MKCFYHSADLDGHCSGALIKLRYPECEMIPIDYGYDPGVWKDLDYAPDETVFMVDFCLQPFEEMFELSNRCNLVWIDHHKTSIENYIKFGKHIIGGRVFLDTNYSACLLTWGWLNTKIDSGTTLEEYLKTAPAWIHYLSEYDCWQDEDKSRWENDIVPFQYGMRIYKTDPKTDRGIRFWKNLVNLSGGQTECLVYDIALKGCDILKYIKQTNAKKCKSFAFETKLKGLSAICINGGGGSATFDSVYDPEKHDIMISFQWLPAHKWTVSLYTTKPEIDVSGIAKSYGGGGHKGAAGFQCTELPFDIYEPNDEI